MTSQKPQLNFWQIWNLCFGFIGIQFGFALQNANVSRIFQILGAPIDNIPILWVAAPITGLLVQPIIGYWSDKTWNRFGRRRPFLLAGAVLASLALFILPNSSALWIAAGMLWIMDASFNIALGPSLALVGDMLPTKQRSTGFAMQSFFIGISAVVASALPWILSHWFGLSNTAAEGVVPPSVKYAFYLGGLILLLSVCWTTYSTKEYSPEDMARFRQDRELIAAEYDDAAPNFFRTGTYFLIPGLLASLLIVMLQLSEQLYILTLGISAFGIAQLTAGFMRKHGKTQNGFYHVTQDLLNMPETMKQLAIVQFLSWFALFSLWIYGTAAVTSFHFGTTDTSSAAYNQGADWVGVLFATYNGCAAIAAIFIPVMIRLTNRKITHMINLCLGGLSLIAFAFIRDPNWLLAPMLTLGFAWASILSLPYAMLSNAVPSHKMGIYAGLFNFFIVIPQILAASILAVVVHHLFHQHTIYALVSGGGFMFLAAITTLFVNEHTLD
jgi:maltose/moltooligosaccharide transporter